MSSPQGFRHNNQLKGNVVTHLQVVDIPENIHQLCFTLCVSVSVCILSLQQKLLYYVFFFCLFYFFSLLQGTHATRCV